MKIFILASLLFTTQSYASQILPAVFYTTPDVKEEFCLRRDYHNENFWRALMKNKIDTLTKGRSYTTHNSYVTKSYLELMERTPSMNGVKFMGYIYSNASHHLGRLVRYNVWPDNHPLKEHDRSFVEGPALRTLTQMFHGTLSSTLMSYSKDLYEELSWSLASASLCGMNYTLGMVKDQNLKKAFRSLTISGFVESFVTYEQTYLHRKMYQSPSVKIPAKGYILDEMRYMAFNGQRHTNFAQWCEVTSCGTSSYDLKNRISYDVWAINNELNFTKANTKTLNTRLKNAKVKETADYFLNLN